VNNVKEYPKYTYDTCDIIEGQKQYYINAGGLSESEAEDMANADEQDSLFWEMEQEFVLDAIAEQLKEQNKDWFSEQYIAIGRKINWQGKGGYRYFRLRESDGSHETVYKLLKEASGGLISEAYLHWSFQRQAGGYYDLHVPHHDADTWIEVWPLKEWIKQESYSELLRYRRELREIEEYPVEDWKRDKESLVDMLCEALLDEAAGIGYGDAGDIKILV
jgi:hypothetical protein